MDWVEKVQKVKADDENFVDFEDIAPNGYALQAVILLDREMEVGDYLLAGLRYADQPDTTFSAYLEQGSDYQD